MNLIIILVLTKQCFSAVNLISKNVINDVPFSKLLYCSNRLNKNKCESKQLEEGAWDVPSIFEGKLLHASTRVHLCSETWEGNTVLITGFDFDVQKVHEPLVDAAFKGSVLLDDTMNCALHALRDMIDFWIAKHSIKTINIFCGHSLGSFLAFDYTYHNPQFVDHLFMLGTPGFSSLAYHSDYNKTSHPNHHHIVLRYDLFASPYCCEGKTTVFGVAVWLEPIAKMFFNKKLVFGPYSKDHSLLNSYLIKHGDDCGETGWQHRAKEYRGKLKELEQAGKKGEFWSYNTDCQPGAILKAQDVLNGTVFIDVITKSNEPSGNHLAYQVSLSITLLALVISVLLHFFNMRKRSFIHV